MQKADKIEADIDKIYKDNQELSIRVGGAENQLKELKETIQQKKVLIIKEQSVNLFKKVWRWFKNAG